MSEIIPRTHYPDRGARGTATLVMEFAHGLPLEGPVTTKRRGSKWYERLEPGTEVLCTPVHGGAGVQRRMRVVRVMRMRLDDLLLVPKAYPDAKEGETWTIVELE